MKIAIKMAAYTFYQNALRPGIVESSRLTSFEEQTEYIT
jgi:hypothetical protein